MFFKPFLLQLSTRTDATHTVMQRATTDDREVLDAGTQCGITERIHRWRMETKLLNVPQLFQKIAHNDGGNCVSPGWDGVHSGAAADASGNSAVQAGMG